MRNLLLRNLGAVASVIVFSGSFANDQALAAVGSSPIIELIRDYDPGRCATYSVKVFDSGLVVYEGKENVIVKGKQTAKISTDSVEQLKKSFETAKFLDFGSPKYEENLASKRRVDCRNDVEIIRQNPRLAKACEGKDFVYSSGFLRVGAGDLLIFRKGSARKRLRVFELGGDYGEIISNLQQQVDDVVETKRWTGPDRCRPTN